MAEAAPICLDTRTACSMIGRCCHPETEGARLTPAAAEVCLVTESDWSIGEGKSKVGLIRVKRGKSGLGFG